MDYSLTDKFVRSIINCSCRILNYRFRKPLLFVLLSLITLSALAPGNNMIPLPAPEPINPFRVLVYATGMVETGGNLLAFNDFEKAVGIFQIRQCRVDEYNRRTGSNHKLADMFDYDVSEKIFLYFASIYGPYHFERIAKAWNGSGPMTELYWKKIKCYLD